MASSRHAPGTPIHGRATRAVERDRRHGGTATLVADVAAGGGDPIDRAGIFVVGLGYLNFKMNK